MSPGQDSVEFPELIFGIAGPIGVDIDAITENIENTLTSVGYSHHIIKLTSEMESIKTNVTRPESRDFYHLMKYKMDRANSICKQLKDPASLARIAILSIMKIRSPSLEVAPAKDKTAYVIRQLKRPQEVELLRRLYGRQFILVSAYGSCEQRKKLIEAKLKLSLPTTTSSVDISCKADELILRDASEEGEEYGQQLRETFHLADVFIDGIDKQEMRKKTVRFIEAFFGKTDIAPSKEEFGMYAAKSASLRSSDLSRQVGAAIFNSDGDLVTQGCNEVPRAFGGTYWDLEEPDYRDVRLGYDPNEVLKKELLRDLFERLGRSGYLSEEIQQLGASGDIVESLIKKAGNSSDRDGPLVGSFAMDLIEYGRVVHAEMCAICDAARLGRSIKGTTLYCTTFPCHQCTKHILASGIKRVVYMEPYPKSKANELHANEIELEKESDDKVSFVPFLGISPYRYRDVFQKGKRKLSNGDAKQWYFGVARPMLDVGSASYIQAEPAHTAALFATAPPET